MPVPPAEVVIELTIHPAEEDNGDPVAAGLRVARESGLAVDIGPGGTGLAGSRDEALQALVRVLEVALEAGARSIDVKVEAPSESR
jgi:uncharacterized protein YqgV (UPF0045/DUF77 family)